MIPEPLIAGDIIKTGENNCPLYVVHALHGDQAWLKDLHTGADAIVMSTRCRKVGRAAA